MNSISLRNSAVLGLSCLMLAFGFYTNANAAVKGDPVSGMKYGAVQIATANATAIPDMNGANAVLVQNLGPNAIYCGNDSLVTTSTGTQVPANGGVLTFDIVQGGAGPVTGTATITPNLWCRSATALQVTPNDTRYIRVK